MLKLVFYKKFSLMLWIITEHRSSHWTSICIYCILVLEKYSEWSCYNNFGHSSGHICTILPIITLKCIQWQTLTLEALQHVTNLHKSAFSLLYTKRLHMNRSNSFSLKPSQTSHTSHLFKLFYPHCRHHHMCFSEVLTCPVLSALQSSTRHLNSILAWHQLLNKTLSPLRDPLLHSQLSTVDSLSGKEN